MDVEKNPENIEISAHSNISEKGLLCTHPFDGSLTNSDDNIHQSHKELNQLSISKVAVASSMSEPAFSTAYIRETPAPNSSTSGKLHK